MQPARQIVMNASSEETRTERVYVLKVYVYDRENVMFEKSFLAILKKNFKYSYID